MVKHCGVGEFDRLACRDLLRIALTNSCLLSKKTSPFECWSYEKDKNMVDIYVDIRSQVEDIHCRIKWKIFKANNVQLEQVIR